ncbi:50S ribosomal protein L4 [Sedimentisphaera cyanobacteriorum]|uniref:Large ribosomal subunit protein uL4 n=1 Tax=Sedimentisphaera cyanobacteriorum TaxID=1940790 RepID=A0A1Q2HPY4_9BACT|nr:50S ribosomal protein L4 [Sedimentisphaera cyanobacteriorum]AQQ09430.1 50S ribosomal protein L4 [Sedimentisphaera cyanobacteriorum]
MIDVTVFNKDGQQVDTISVNEESFGGEVRYPLLKQAIVMYHANKRVGTAATKSRGMVAGSSKKLFRQKGTGNARVGNMRTHKRVGGGAAFAKSVRDFGKKMPRKQRNLACKSALLAKLQSGALFVIDELSFSEPKTREMAGILKNLNIDRSCLVTLGDYDTNVYKSAKNIQKIDVAALKDLNAGEVCSKQKLLFTKEAFEKLLNG